MPFLQPFLAKLRRLFAQKQDDREFTSEIQTHIQLLTERFEHQGMSHEEALSAARRQFGNTTLHHQHRRDLRSFLALATLARDLRFAARQLYRNPLLTIVAIVSLALGIGANTAIFSIAKRVLFDPLPVHNPKELRVLTWTTNPQSGQTRGHEQPVPPVWGDISSTPSGGFESNSFSYPIYQALLQQSSAFQNLIAFKDVSLTATIDGTPQLISAELLSGNAFESLGLKATLGRALTPSDDVSPGAGPVAVITDSFWAQQFARSPTAVGKIIFLNGISFTIVGIAPAPFAGLDTAVPSRIFVPITMQPLIVPRPQGGNVSLLDNPGSWWLQIIARLRADVSESQAQAQLDVALRQAALPVATYAGGMETFHLELDAGSRGQDNLQGELAKPSWILLALSGLVLLLACVNLANLLLARATSRQREMSTRLALGARRNHILRQMLTESLLLSSLGGAAGLALGYLGRNAIPGMIADPTQAAAIHASFDWQVLAFTAAISLATGILFGLIPAWQATQTDLTSAIKDSGQTTSTRSRLNLGKSLVIFQIALSTILLLGAALFVRTLINLSNTPLGFRADHMLLFRLDPPSTRYNDAQWGALYRQLEQRLAAIPGVSSVSFSTIAIIGDGNSGSTFHLPGSPDRPTRVQANTVGSDFFATMGIPILQGRSFTAHDTSTSPVVAVINRALAQRFFPNKNPIGQTFDADSDEATVPVQIIGVVADTRYADLRTPTPPTFYLSYQQHLEVGRTVVEIRTADQQFAPGSILTQTRAVVASLDRNLPLIDVRTMREQVASTISSERIFAQLTAAFGILALILACIGIYGVMAYTVSRRTSEIGIRMALGAQTSQVLTMVLREVSWMALGGVASGIAIALWLARFISSMLYGLNSYDPLTLIGTASVLIAISLFAGFAPARRASRINPTQALRHD
jgi:predicted permease